MNMTIIGVLVSSKIVIDIGICHIDLQIRSVLHSDNHTSYVMGLLLSQLHKYLG